MLLARGGLRTLLLDQSAEGSDTLSTHALMRGGVLQLSRWGVLHEIIAAGTPPVRRVSFRYGDEKLVVSVKPTHGVDALYAPRRTVLDPVLVRAAVKAGVEVHHRTAVTGLITHDGRVYGVHATTPDDRAVDLGAQLVIGADGIRSTVARYVDAPFTRVGTAASAATYGYWSDFDTDGYEWIFHPNACAGVIPTNDGQACVFVVATPERIGRGGIPLINYTIADSEPALAQRLRMASAPRGARTWKGRPGYLRRAHGPGWALVGDAGYYKDPVSAHGLTDALRDAELLAVALLDGFDDHALDDALEHYERTRDRLSIPLFDSVDRIASQQWAYPEIAQLLLQLNAATADEVETLAALEMEKAS
jgi:2-polyprenyl-6-methoxyphenol hydroxylase-like FAD-dependent oxidoreductase